MVRVVTAAQAAARDAGVIRAGTPSRTLMQRAGEAAADLIRTRYGQEASARGVSVFTGGGNNGGDGWVVARRLAERGLAVHVIEVIESRTDDARAERALALPLVRRDPPTHAVGVVIDALLGTGARSGLDASLTAAVQSIAALRDAGAIVVALDLPTGVDASAGRGEHAGTADLTVSFGTVKRGHLLSRGACGAIVVADVGLGAFAELDDGAPSMVDAAWVAATVPPIPADAHKGSRRRVAIVGGARGMAGAVILAGRAALRTGIGMVRAVVEDDSLAAVQTALPEATAAVWPAAPDTIADVCGWADAVLIGPGLGQSSRSHDVLARVLDHWRGPLVVDADAITRFAGDLPGLRAAIAGCRAVITPHVGEMARLIERPTDAVLAARFDLGREVAQQIGATVLLKGTPTVITANGGEVLVSASGTPALATAGSGDVLGGMLVTLLAQSGDPFRSAASAAWVHGRAAEMATAGRTVRGVTLEDVLHAIAHVWAIDAAPPEPPTLLELPAVADPARYA